MENRDNLEEIVDIDDEIFEPILGEMLTDDSFAFTLLSCHLLSCIFYLIVNGIKNFDFGFTKASVYSCGSRNLLSRLL